MVKRIITIILILVFVLATVMWLDHMEKADFYYVLYYWIILGLVVFSVLFYKISTVFTLGTAFFITVVAAFIGLVSILDIGESVMRLGFVFWLVGAIKLLVE